MLMVPPLLLPDPDVTATSPALLLAELLLLSLRSPASDVSEDLTPTMIEPLLAWLLPDFISIDPLCPLLASPLDRTTAPLDTYSPATSPDASEMVPDLFDALAPDAAVAAVSSSTRHNGAAIAAARS